MQELVIMIIMTTCGSQRGIFYFSARFQGIHCIITSSSIVSSSVAIQNSKAEGHERGLLLSTATRKQRPEARNKGEFVKAIPSDLLSHSAISTSVIQPTDEVNILMPSDTTTSQ